MAHKKEKTALEAPRIPNHLNPLEAADYDIHDKHLFEDGIFTQASIANQTADKVCFDRVVFDNVAFNEINFERAEITDVRFERCDLSNVRFRDSVFHRVEFNQCKMLGSDLTSSTLRNVRFQECNGLYSVFRFTDLKQTSIHGSSFDKADFYQATFTKVELIDTSLDQAQLTGVKLAGIDLSQCQFDTLGVSLPDIHGSIMSIDQVSAFAYLLGVVLKE